MTLKELEKLNEGIWDLVHAGDYEAIHAFHVKIALAIREISKKGVAGHALLSELKEDVAKIKKGLQVIEVKQIELSAQITGGLDAAGEKLKIHSKNLRVIENKLMQGGI